MVPLLPGKYGSFGPRFCQIHIRMRFVLFQPRVVVGAAGRLHGEVRSVLIQLVVIESLFAYPVPLLVKNDVVGIF